jgi:hypothetical protein
MNPPAVTPPVPLSMQPVWCGAIALVHAPTESDGEVGGTRISRTAIGSGFGVTLADRWVRATAVPVVAVPASAVARRTGASQAAPSRGRAMVAPIKLVSCELRAGVRGDRFAMRVGHRTVIVLLVADSTIVLPTF